MPGVRVKEEEPFESVLKRFKKILVPELNTGQLSWLLRAKYLAPAQGLNKVQGKPFLVSEIEAGSVRALFVVGGNPVVAFPDRDRLVRALQRLELLVARHIGNGHTITFVGY